MSSADIFTQHAMRQLAFSRDSTDAYQEAPVCLIWAFFVRQNHNMVTFDEENDRLVDNFVQFWLKSL